MSESKDRDVFLWKTNLSPTIVIINPPKYFFTREFCLYGKIQYITAFSTPRQRSRTRWLACADSVEQMNEIVMSEYRKLL